MPGNESVPPQVSVVIPTRERPELVGRAVRSALAQEGSEIEVIVVLDGPDEATVRALASVDDPRLRVLALPERAGLGAARNAGVKAARSPWVGLLDDDDEWLPGKLKTQLDVAQRARCPSPIVSCRFIARREQGDVVLPRRVPGPHEAISEYLFCQTRLLGGEGVILPSTILAPRAVFERTPFRHERLPHEGSDWLLHALLEEGVGVEFVAEMEPLVIWHAEGTHSRIGNSNDWQASLAWADQNAASQEARRGRHWAAFWRLPQKAFHDGRPTGIGLLAHASIWLVPASLRFHMAALLSQWRA
jgi:glycosyltransferase involved in cell wall biosynthesis